MQIEINNLKINYIEKGSKTNTSIILLHGWGASIAAFNPVIENLSKTAVFYLIKKLKQNDLHFM